MIEISIKNAVEVARCKSSVAKLLPGLFLHTQVEKKIAAKIQKVLAREGVEAVVNLNKSA